MNFLSSPKNKLLAASAALAALLVLASLNGVSTTGVARAVLAVAALAGVGWWWVRAQKVSAVKKFQFAPRLSVVSRAGLSQRAGLALIDVDGRSFLVVHGEGYAEICATQDPKPQPKPPRPLRATDSLAKLPPRGTGIR